MIKINIFPQNNRNKNVGKPNVISQNNVVLKILKQIQGRCN